jgi:hypothetical protein
MRDMRIFKRSHTEDFGVDNGPFDDVLPWETNLSRSFPI